MTETKSVYFYAKMITSHRWQLAWKQMVQQKNASPFMKKGWQENKELPRQLKLSCL